MAVFVAHVTLDHLSRLEEPDPEDLSGKTASQKATAKARTKGYDGICLPLTTDQWKARWRELCLIHAEGSPDTAALEQSAENWRARPVFLRDEVTITRLGALCTCMCIKSC
jgi:type II protein arginine methyltransferase